MHDAAGRYPDRDVNAMLLQPAHRRPFPVVVDADALIRDIVKTARERKQTILRGLGEDRYANLMATDVVHDEVERHLDEVAGEDAATAWGVWSDQYRPLLRWVEIPRRSRGTPIRPGENELVQRLDGVANRHPKDVPTAELALMCAPCFVVSGDRRHLHVEGFGRAGWLHDLTAAGELATIENAAHIMLVLAGSITESAARGGRALGRLIGRSEVGLALVGVAAGMLLSHGFHNREGMGRRLGNALDVYAELAERLSTERAARLARITDALVLPLTDPPVHALVAQVLARATAPFTIAELVGRVGGTVDESAVLSCVKDHPMFVFAPGRGWALGRLAS